MKIIENYQNNILELGSFKALLTNRGTKSKLKSSLNCENEIDHWEFNTYVIILIIHAKLKLFFGAQMSAPSN